MSGGSGLDYRNERKVNDFTVFQGREVVEVFLSKMMERCCGRLKMESMLADDRKVMRG